MKKSRNKLLSLFEEQSVASTEGLKTTVLSLYEGQSVASTKELKNNLLSLFKDQIVAYMKESKNNRLSLGTKNNLFSLRSKEKQPSRTLRRAEYYLYEGVKEQPSLPLECYFYEGVKKIPL